MTVREQMSVAARRGDVDAQFALAEHYELVVPRRLTRAAKWYRRAAQQGHVEAQNIWAVCLRDGVGVAVDRRMAVSWFRKAASNGNALATLSLGYALFEGEGVDRDQVQALALYRRAARAGDDDAMFNLGQMSRCGDVVPKNRETAIRWYKRAAEKGHIAAAAWLGWFYSESRLHRQQKLAVDWLIVAANEGDAWAIRLLGVCFSNGDGIEQDDEEAASCWRIAASLGDSWSEYLLGIACRDGLGIKQSRRWALFWLKKAASHGEEEAAEALEVLG